MYFKINEEFLVSRDASGCIIYNLLNNKSYLFDSIQANIIFDLESNIEIDELYTNYSKVKIDELLDYLVGESIGTKYTDKCSITKLRTIPKVMLEDKDSLLPFRLKGAVIELTGECNLECIFCTEYEVVYRSCGCKKWSYEKEMSDENWIDLINRLLFLGVEQVVFSGGEPLLKIELLINLISILMENNIEIKIFTNGTIINKSLIDKIQEYPKISFIIQVLSINNNTYEIITGERNIFQVIESNIQLLKEKSINYTIQLLIGSFNELELNSMKNYFPNNRTIISYIYPTNKYTGSTTETKERLIDFRDKRINVNLLNYHISQNFNICLNGSIFISANGDVHPCMMLRDFKLGNIVKAPIHKVFQNKGYREFWELSKNKVDGCKSCKYNLQCIDCRALEYYTTSKLYGMIHCDNLTTQL